MGDCCVPRSYSFTNPDIGRRECGCCGSILTIALPHEEGDINERLDAFITRHGWVIDWDNNCYICPECMEEN